MLNRWRLGEVWDYIAKEGACWVLGSGSAIRASDIPDNFPGKTTLYPDPDEWVNVGDSVVVAPGGELVAGPMHKEQGILYADIDVNKSPAAHRKLDVAGHYARPDIFKLHVNTSLQSPFKLDWKVWKSFCDWAKYLKKIIQPQKNNINFCISSFLYEGFFIFYN